MKTTNIIMVAVITALAGLGAGYLLFGGKRASEANQISEATSKEQIWTCAMHPQIRQNEPGQCPICGMDLIPLGESSSAGNPQVMEMTLEAAKLADIRTIMVGSGSAGNTKSIVLTGKVQADERRVASQVVHIPGRIEQLFVTFTGEPIRPGQKLAVIYSPELVTAQRELIEAYKWKDTRPQLLEAARNKIRYWKFPDTFIQQIEESGEIEANITIHAEHAGTVLKRRVAVGDYVREGGVLFDIVNLNRVWVLFDAYEEDLSNIRTGDAVSFTTAAVPGRTFKARIAFIDPMINAQTRVASLRAEVPNSQGLLKPEMLVNGTIETKTSSVKGTLTVPKTAVLWTGARSVVYVEQPDASVPSFEYREITLGETFGLEYVVLEGLDAGERVVVNGAFVIDAAAQLNNQASMMNRNVRLAGMVASGPDYRQETPDEFRNQLMEVTQTYVQLKDALVNSDPAAAKTAGGVLITVLDSVDMNLIRGDAHIYWMQKLDALKAHNNAIVADEDVEEQRKQFSFLSTALVQALTAFGTSGDSLYLQHCPMAFDNAGADWLSNERIIRNPYFGDKMLTCGSVLQTFPMEQIPTTSQDRPVQIHQH